MGEPGKAIEVRHLEKWYGQRKVLRDLSFDVCAGQVVALLGPNGAGKTTTMRILAGVLAEDAGVVRILGSEVRRPEVMRAVGYMPENPPFYRGLTVRQQLRFWARLRDVPKEIVNRSVSDAIARAGLAEVETTMAQDLSKGYKQRLGLAQALVHNPSILILDEPTAGLDPRQIVETRALISSFRNEKTVLLSTHILADASAMCDLVFIMNEGTIVGEGRAYGDRMDIGALERLYLDTVHRS